jgi:hypothetical protein
MAPLPRPNAPCRNSAGASRLFASTRRVRFTRLSRKSGELGYPNTLSSAKAQKLPTAAPLCQTHAYSPAVFRQRLAASRKGPANASASLNNSRSLSIPAVNTMKAAVRFVGNLEAEAAEVFTLSPSFPVQIVEHCRDAHAVSLASDSSQP